MCVCVCEGKCVCVCVCEGKCVCDGKCMGVNDCIEGEVLWSDVM